MNEFNPMLTPREMFQKGIFGGSYFGPNAGPKMKTELADILMDELIGIPQSLWNSSKYVTKVNLFNTKAGSSYTEWLESGWISEADSYGWVEWYIKYSRGRRCEDDNRQIQRWKSFCGVNGRWRNTIYSKIYSSGDWNISPRIQQSLLHWGYEVNEIDYNIWKNYDTSS